MRYSSTVERGKTDISSWNAMAVDISNADGTSFVHTASDGIDRSNPRVSFRKWHAVYNDAAAPKTTASRLLFLCTALLATALRSSNGS